MAQFESRGMDETCVFAILHFSIGCAWLIKTDFYFNSILPLHIYIQGKQTLRIYSVFNNIFIHTSIYTSLPTRSRLHMHPTPICLPNAGLGEVLIPNPT